MGGKILVDQLAIQGMERAFCIPGESFLPVLDAFCDHPQLHMVPCRHEGGAAMMAEATGKLTGKPGICFVTRGPGAMNAAHAVHIAMQDSTPMILFIGDIPAAIRDREAFQEVDFSKVFSPLAKWAARIDVAERIPEYISRAYHVAMSGRPGPVILALPEDMLSSRCDVADIPPARIIAPRAAAGDMAAFARILQEAKRPLVIAGGPGWNAAAVENLQAFAARHNLPVAASFRAQDRFDNTHPNYAGHAGIGIDPNLAESIRQADMLVSLGARLGEMTTGCYSLIKSPLPAQKLVMIHPGTDELAAVYYPELAINASVVSFTAALAGLPSTNNASRSEWTKTITGNYRDHIKPRQTPGALKMERVILHLRKTLPENAILTNGAGNYTAWLHRYYQYRAFPGQLAPTNGSMGYGLPAAIAARLEHPDRPVIAFAGDGCFQMSMQELAVAVQEKAAIIIMVVNNRMYGTIRMHQERRYPGRVSATALANPDFVALARACGAAAELVRHDDEFAAAFERALAADVPALIELQTDAMAITPSARLDEL